MKTLLTPVYFRRIQDIIRQFQNLKKITMYYTLAVIFTTARLGALIVLIDKVQAEARANGTDE